MTTNPDPLDLTHLRADRDAWQALAEVREDLIHTLQGELDAERKAREAAESKALEYGAECGRLDNDLVGCREVSFKAQADRDSLRAQLLEAQGQVAAMVASMGEEWIFVQKHPPVKSYSFCRECLENEDEGHAPDCVRGRFFALAPTAGREWVAATECARKALEAFLAPKQNSDTYPRALMGASDALARLAALGIGGTQ